MEFVREVLGICAPRVFAWSANATANTVGTEYIIMERMSGVESHHRWAQIAKAPEVFPLLDGVFGIERNFERPPFSPVHVANSTWKQLTAPQAVHRASVTP